MTLDSVLDRIDADLDAALDRTMALMRIPSISTDPAHADDCRAAADWLVGELTDLGFAATAHATPGHPMVVAHGGAGGRPLLFYGHYDVQPVDPLDLWDRDPFDPTIEAAPHGRIIRGRGASDDKGQLMTFLTAIRAWRDVHGALPRRLTILFEGEEESGSPSLVPFLRDHADALRADLALICDTGLFDRETPAITTMLRGLLGEEVTIRGADRDLHSGMFGGLAANPIHILSGILADLRDATGRIAIPGFYDGVDEIDDAVAAQWAALDFDADAFLGGVGLSRPVGEAGRSPLEKVWARPTAEVNGIRGGYAGAGFKTVLPAEAAAKISFRLVGRQDPHAIRTAFRDWVRERVPADCDISFADHGASHASVMDTSDPAFERARQALSREWPNPAALVGSGGSIPIAGHFKTELGMDSMLIGFGNEDDRIHSPNEKYDVASFHRGARAWARILDAIG